MTTIDVELMHAWMRADAPACCVALAKLGAKERAAALGAMRAGRPRVVDEARAGVVAERRADRIPDLPWNEAIVEAGVDINVIRMLRSARREVREHRLASFPERQRARIARALVLPRDRVLSALDDRPLIAHLSETAGTVLNRIGSTARARRIVDLSRQ